MIQLLQTLDGQHPVFQTLFQLCYGLAHHPVLLALLFLVVLMLTGKLDRYGVGDLFFGIPRWQRFWAGLAVGLLVQMLLVTAYQIPRMQARVQEPTVEQEQTVAQDQMVAQGQKTAQGHRLELQDRGVAISVLSGAGFSLLLLMYFLYGKWAMLRSRTAAENCLSMTMFLGFLLSTLPAGYLLSVHPDYLGRQLDWLNVGLHSSQSSVFGGWALGLLLLMLFPFLLLLLHVVQARFKGLTAAVPVCVLLMLATAGYFVLTAFISVGASTILVGAIAVTLWAGRNPYRCELPGMHDRYLQRVNLREVVDQRYGLDPWNLEKLGPLGAKPKYRDGTVMEHRRDEPFVILCTSGGGIKAAAWTVAALSAIHQRVPEFHRHLRMITGASGGMVGAGFYVEALARAQSAGGTGAVDFPALYDRATRDMLSSVVRRMVFGDLGAYLLPFSTPNNRGLALEGTWPELQALQFGKLLSEERAGRMPSLVYSPMMVEDGRRLLISNLDLSSSITNRAFTIGTGSEKAALLSVSGLEFRRLFSDQEMDRLCVSTAARLSASFPYVTPAVSLPTIPRRRIVDAGYYDNFGVNLATDWIRTHRQWLKEHASQVIVVQLRCNMEEMQRQGRFEGASTKTAHLLAGWEWLTTPIEGAASAREAGMAFRNDELLESIGDFLSASQLPFSTMLLECNVAAPLSWSLTQREKDAMVSGADSLGARLDDLAERLRTPNLAAQNAADYIRRREDAGSTTSAHRPLEKKGP